jgi:tetratricopeptide (TPR) repeat protein
MGVMLENRKLLALLCLILPSLASFVAAKNVRHPRALYERANELYLNADFKSALGYANKSIIADPNWLKAYGLRASIEKNLGETQLAAKDGGFVLSHLTKPLRELSTGELLAAGSALEIRDEPRSALKVFAELLSRGIKTSEVLAGRSLAYEALDKNDQALGDIDDAIHIEPAPPVIYLYRRGGILYRKGRYPEALKNSLDALGKNKSFLEAYLLLGKILAKRGDAARATAAFEKASKINPDDDRPYLALAKIEFAQKNDVPAFSNLDRGVKSVGGDSKPYLARAHALFAKGLDSKAMADYQRALKLDWISPRIAIQIGDHFRKLKEDKKSIQAYSKAYEESLCPKAPCSESFLLALIKRAETYATLKNQKEELKDLSLAIAMGPRSALPWTLRAEIEKTLGQKREALADLDQAAEIAPGNSDVRLARAALYVQLRKFNKATEDFDIAIGTDPSNARAYNDRGIFYAHSLHNSDFALKDLLKAVALDPKSPIYQYNLGVIEFERSEFLHSLASLDNALRLGGSPIFILAARANVYSLLGDRVNMLKDLNVVITQNHKYAHAYDIDGLMELRQNNYAEALRLFKRAWDMDDKNPIYLIHLARAYGALGEVKEAFDKFKAAEKMNPRSRQAMTGMCESKRILQKPTEAISFCNQAISLDPSYFPAYIERGLSHLALHEAKATLDDLNRAIILGARISQLHLAKAVAHAATHHYRQAHADYEAAVGLTPIAHSPNIGFALITNNQDDFYWAVSGVSSLLVADEDNPYFLLVKGDTDVNSKRFDEAITRYSRALDHSPSNPDILAARGAAYMSYHLYDPARTDLESALKIKPHDPAFHLQLASILIVRKNYERAITEAIAALKLDPMDARAYFLAGNARYFQGNFKKALDNYLLSAQKDPKNSDAYNGVGLGYFALGNYTQAIAAFSRAIRLSPMAAHYWRNRGSAYTKMGQYENAALDFKSASVLNQNPKLLGNYRKLIKQAESLVSNKIASSLGAR